MAVKTKSDCFRVGELYGEMRAGSREMLWALDDRDLRHFGAGAFKVYDAARDLWKQYIPDELPARVRDLAGSLRDAARAIEEARERGTDERYAEIKDGVLLLIDLTDLDMRALVKGRCRG